jgi:hypothetical protein
MVQIFVRVVVGEVTAELTTLLLLPQMLVWARAPHVSELLSFTSLSLLEANGRAKVQFVGCYAVS